MTRPPCDVCGARIVTPGAARCWRHRGAGRPKRTASPRRGAGHRDPVTDSVAASVGARDRGCIGPRVGMPGRCAGRDELDHVDGAGLGRRGPSVTGNLATLCSHHHRVKTEAANTWRPVLRAWIAGHPVDVANHSGTA